MTLFRAIFVVLCVVGMSACANLGGSYDPPKVKVTSLELLPSQGLSQRFLIGLQMTNPNSGPMPIRGFSYTLALNGYDLLDGVSNKMTTIPAYSEQAVTVEASTDLIAAMRFLNDFLGKAQQDTLAYALTANLDVGGVLRRIRVTESGEVPLLRP